MTQDDLERLAELEAMLDEDEELDEDERDELRELRAIARQEKRTAKALAKFDKARIVFKVTTPIIGAGNTPTGENYVCYALDLATARECTGQDPSGIIEEIDRKSLTGRYRGEDCFTDTACAVCGAYSDAGEWPSCPSCLRPVCSKCEVTVDDGHWGYWGCPSCMAVTQEYYEAQKTC